MSLRTAIIDFTAETPIAIREIGFIGEHNATTLKIIPPIDMSKNADVFSYCIAFQLADGSIIHSRTFAKNEEISLDLWQQLTENSMLGIQLEGNDTNENLIAKSLFIRNLVFLPSPCGAEGKVDTDNDSLISEVAQNSSARHTHENKSVIDKLGENSDGKLSYNGEEVGKDKSVVYIGADEPTDLNIKVWINPEVNKGRGYPLLRTVSVNVPSEGFLGYVNFADITFVCIRRTAVDKLIPTNAKIFGIDFVIDGEHYFNSEIKIYSTYTRNLAANFEFFPRHNEYADATNQNIAQLVGNNSSQIAHRVSEKLTEFIVYYYEINDSVAVIKTRDDNGEWQYIATATGEKGDTPIRGLDYWTNSDKLEIVNDTLNALPTWTGGSY